MLFLAFRYLFSKKRRTALIFLGILLGTTAFVAISGMMLGFQTFIADQLINNDAHIRVTARESSLGEHDLDRVLFGSGEAVNWFISPSGRRDNARIEHPQGWFDRLDKDQRVAAYSPQLSIQVLARYAKITVNARLIGSEPERQTHVTNIQNYMIKGNFKDIGTSGNRVLAGDGLLERLGARSSETLLISVGQGAPSVFKIVGVFHTGIRTLDDSTLYGSLADVQRVNKTPSVISDIAIRLNDVSNAAVVADSWSSISPDNVQSWDQANAGILQVFKTQNIIRNSMTISILIVAGFGIYNILSMLVAQKRQEIAILRSMGYESRDILWLFLVQGLFLGVVGGIVGVCLGFIICKWMSTIEIAAGSKSSSGGLRAFGGTKMMVSFDMFIYLRAFTLALFASMAAAILPARAAAKLNPIDVIRAGGQ